MTLQSRWRARILRPVQIRRPFAHGTSPTPAVTCQPPAPTGWTRSPCGNLRCAYVEAVVFLAPPLPLPRSLSWAFWCPPVVSIVIGSMGRRPGYSLALRTVRDRGWVYGGLVSADAGNWTPHGHGFSQGPGKFLTLSFPGLLLCTRQRALPIGYWSRAARPAAQHQFQGHPPCPLTGPSPVSFGIKQSASRGAVKKGDSNIPSRVSFNFHRSIRRG